MKFATVPLFICLSTTSAFVSRSSNGPLNTALNAESSRRQMLEQFGIMGAAFVATTLPANAGLLDDSGFQDLLPADAASQVRSGGEVYKPKRPSYLDEPTEEFKESEKAAAEFRKQQIIFKKKFNTVVDRLLSEPNDEAAMVADLNELQYLVIQCGGLPVGLKKEDLYKQIRVKKRAGFWPTNVEIAYQKLINEVIFQQSPNIEDKSGGNKFSGGL